MLNPSWRPEGESLWRKTGAAGPRLAPARGPRARGSRVSLGG
jgi:hypothetical protein